MDLLGKALLGALVVAAVILIIYESSSSQQVQPVTKSQAVALILSDLQNTYPQAMVNITNVTSSQYAGSWHISASVVTNATRACPSYYIYTFDYPQYGFVPRVQNTYTSNCIVYGFQQNKTYLITSYPVAIARSYNLSIPLIVNYVNTYGYNNVVVSAKYYTGINLFSSVYQSVWLVNYTAPTANHSAYVLITQLNGQPILNYTINRS